MIAPCTCAHEYQDKVYGKGNRVKNPTKSAPITYRCTVCGQSK